MKRINLMTSRNDQYRGVLERAGYEIHAAAVDSVDEIHSLPAADFCIIEISDANPDTESMLGLVLSRGKLLVLVKESTEEIRKLLIKLGISDLLTGPAVRYCVSCLNAIMEVGECSRGDVLVLETEDHVVRMLNSIADRFLLSTAVVSSVRDLYDAMEAKSFQMIMINLDADNIDLNALVRNSYNRPEIRSIPLYTYKDPGKGILVHELVCGLNRITRYILDSRELFGFLVTMLMRRDITGIVSDLSLFFDHDGGKRYLQDPLSSMLKQGGDGLFGSPWLGGADDFEKGMDMIARLKKALLRWEGLRWLQYDFKEGKISRSGRGE